MKSLLTLLFLLTALLSNAQNLNKITGLESTAPAVAYSLRQLSTSYTGPLVRIKVGASFYDVYPDVSTTKFSLSSKISAPISPYTAAVAAAGTNALSTIISGSTDATVAIWYDQSGNGVHVLSNTSSPSAKIITAGSINTIFGQPTIYFSGSDSKLGSSTTVNYSALSGATVNAVAQNLATTSGYAGIIGAATAGTYPGYNISYTSGVGYQSDGDGCGYRTSVNSTDPKIVTSIFINNTTNLSKIYVNNELKTNVAVTSGTCALSHTSGSKIFIGVSRGFGSASTFIGNISEAILFPSQLSDALRNSLESNQSSAYFSPTVTITSSASGAVCAGTSVTFTATTYNFSGTPTYQWYKNSVAINGETNATYTTSTLANADQIYVTATPGYTSGSISTSNLIANFDAANYTTTSTRWTDLSTSANHMDFYTSTSYSTLKTATYSTDGGGSLILNNNSVYGKTINNTGISGNGGKTMSAWVRFDATDRDWTSIASIGEYVAGKLFEIYAQRNGTSSQLIFHWSGSQLSNYADLPKDTWYYVTIKSDGSNNNYIYINGVQVASATQALNITNSPLYMGAPKSYSEGGWNDNLRGRISTLSLYNASLSAQTILDNYNATKGRYTVSSVSSNSLSTTITSGPSAVVTVSGDGCINKTTLSTPTGQTSYLWYKDNAPISGATSNTYSPTTAGDYKVQVTSGTCSAMSAATTISVCGVTADGRMRSIATPTTLVSQEGGVNFGTGVSEVGKTVNATGIGTTLGTVGATTAVVSGVISSTNALTTSIGVIYSTDSNFGTFSTSSTQSNVASGTHVFTLSGLASTTPYYAKSFIVNKAGTSYGAVISFTTLAVVPTLAATTAASAIAGTTATSGGDITSDGGSAVTARGIVWGTATNPTIALTTKTTDGAGTGVFTSSLTGLTAATLYYVRSYATNAIGTSYGAEISFTTLDVVSTVTSPYTGKVWMDRNLGATRAATSVNDEASYGDLYQWGRAKDGGQLRSATQTATRLTDISSRSIYSISAQPWTSQANWNSQTGGVWDVKPWNNTDGGVNNPCPTGFRVPSDSEWTAELNGMTGAGLATTTTGVFNSFLKIPQAGVIEGSGFSGTVITTKSVYWTTDRLDGYSSREIRFSPSQNAERNANWYSFRYSVRCIAN